MKPLQTYLLALLLVAGGLTSCKKDQVPKPAEPTKWEKIVGNYKVYDTTGTYLYDMEIKHYQYPGEGIHTIDTLEYIGLGGKFNFKSFQGIPASNWVDTYIRIYAPNPTIDTNGKRWQVNGVSDNDFVYNTWRNDSIRLRFRTVNILYYLSDLVPYCDSTYVQVAVKQH